MGEEITNGKMTNYILIYPGVTLIIINCFGHSGKLLTAQGTAARSATPSVSFVAARSWGSVERGKLAGGSRRAGGNASNYTSMELFLHFKNCRDRIRTY